jgi:hypothetical protein
MSKRAWIDIASCRTKSASLLKHFYSKDKEDIKIAKAICSECLARSACYDYAVKNKEPAGVWGGVVFSADGPLIEQAIIPRTQSYVYVPIRVHHTAHFRGRDDKVEQLPAVDPISTRQSDQE